jgi:hypothetical protein
MELGLGRFVEAVMLWLTLAPWIPAVVLCGCATALFLREG